MKKEDTLQKQTQFRIVCPLPIQLAKEELRPPNLDSHQIEGSSPYERRLRPFGSSPSSEKGRSQSRQQTERTQNTTKNADVGIGIHKCGIRMWILMGMLQCIQV